LDAGRARGNAREIPNAAIVNLLTAHAAHAQYGQGIEALARRAADLGGALRARDRNVKEGYRRRGHGLKKIGAAPENV